ncbi:MAG: ArsR/SmtB family transcription factor [Gammaproteobacteria bacterium]
MQMAADRATDLLKALASRNRLLLLCHLLDGEKSVGELARLLEVRDSAVSQQLALLRKDGLVRTRRQGQTIYYGLASPKAAKVIETLYALYCAPAAAESSSDEAGPPGLRPR